MSFRANKVGVVLSAVALFSAPSGASAQEVVKGQGSGFRLFARAEATIAINRVECHVDSYGQLCSYHQNTQGGMWPKGSSQQYIFGSGLWVAGQVEPGIPAFSWSGDTTGAYFYDLNGTR